MSFSEPRFRMRIIPNFWPRAQEARERFAAHAGNPHSHGMDSGHQIWNYWYLPNLYCYLRTDPRKVLGDELINDFNTTLAAYAHAELGEVQPMGAWLTLHLAGMRHDLHNDSRNGTYAFVFSLTPQPMKFTGGETCLLKENAMVLEPRQNNAWNGLMDIVVPTFNQLLLFDDRVPHQVPPVMGSLDPVEGRLALTGHLK